MAAVMLQDRKNRTFIFSLDSLQRSLSSHWNQLTVQLHYATSHDCGTHNNDTDTHTHMDSYLHHEFLWPIRRKEDIVNDTRNPVEIRNLQLHDAQIDNHTNIQHDSYYVLQYAVRTLIYNIRYYIPQCNVLDQTFHSSLW